MRKIFYFLLALMLVCSLAIAETWVNGVKQEEETTETTWVNGVVQSVETIPKVWINGELQQDATGTAVEGEGNILWDGTDVILWDGTDKILWE